MSYHGEQISDGVLEAMECFRQMQQTVLDNPNIVTAAQYHHALAGQMALYFLSADAWQYLDENEEIQ